MTNVRGALIMYICNLTEEKAVKLATDILAAIDNDENAPASDALDELYDVIDDALESEED